MRERRYEKYEQAARRSLNFKEGGEPQDSLVVESDPLFQFKNMAVGGLPIDLQNHWLLSYSSNLVASAGVEGVKLLRRKLPTLAEYIQSSSGSDVALEQVRALPGFNRQAEEQYDKLVAQYNATLDEDLNDGELVERLTAISQEARRLFEGIDSGLKK